jgi:hypothetical protein
MTPTRLTERTMAGQRGYASSWVLGLLIRRSQQMADKQDYELMNAIDLENRRLAAIIGPQSELFPMERPKPAPFQLRFPGF